MRLASAACMFVVSVAALAALPPAPTSLTLELKDVAPLPITGKLDGAGQVDGMLARVNSIREEPGGADRWFVTDMNGPIYVFNKKTKALDHLSRLQWRRRARRTIRSALSRSGL